MSLDKLRGVKSRNVVLEEVLIIEKLLELYKKILKNLEENNQQGKCEFEPIDEELKKSPGLFRKCSVRDIEDLCVATEDADYGYGCNENTRSMVMGRMVIFKANVLLP